MFIEQSISMLNVSLLNKSAQRREDFTTSVFALATQKKTKVMDDKTLTWDKQEQLDGRCSTSLDKCTGRALCAFVLYKTIMLLK